MAGLTRSKLIGPWTFENDAERFSGPSVHAFDAAQRNAADDNEPHRIYRSLSAPADYAVCPAGEHDQVPAGWNLIAEVDYDGKVYA